MFLLTFKPKNDDRDQWYLYRTGDSPAEITMFGPVGEIPILRTEYAVQRAIELLSKNNQDRFAAGQEPEKVFGFQCLQEGLPVLGG